MSTQEIFVEEIRHQPETVLREMQRYLEFPKRQNDKDTGMEQVVADSWEKLGPAPEVDYDKL